MICIAVASFLIEQNKLQFALIEQINGTVGVSAGATILQLMNNIKAPTTNLIAFVSSIVILIWSSIGLFSEIQFCFNYIWKVRPHPHFSWLRLVKSRFYYFIMIMSVGFLLLVSLVVSASLSAVSTHFHYIFPNEPYIWVSWDIIISIGLITLLFAVFFKVLPEVSLQWRDVLLAAFLTSLLFSSGKYLLSVYLASSNITTIYGAAASFVILLLWVYYTTQILLWGVEFSKVYARRYGSHMHLSEPDQIIGF